MAVPARLSVNYATRIRNAILGLAPLGYWPASDVVGTTVYDRGSTGQNGVIGGTISVVTGHRGIQAYRCLGVPVQRVLVGDHDNWTITTTKTWWFLFNSEQENLFRGFMGKHDSATPEWDIYLDNGGLGWAVIRNTIPDVYLFATTPSRIDNGNWHSLAVTADVAAPSLSIYFDGVLAASDTTTTGTQRGNTGLSFCFGARNEGGTGHLAYKGQIAEPAIFAEALTSAQIQALHRAAGLS